MTMLDLSLEGKVAIVTGGSKGIGRAIAIAYAEKGANVAIASRGKEALEQTAKEIEARGSRVLALPTDVSVTADLERLHGETVAQLGDVDILVNNAAFGGLERAPDLDEEQFDRTMRTNVWAPLRLAQLCHPAMKKRGSGVILNIASNEFAIGSIGMGVYPPSKAALSNLTIVLAKEWGKEGIRVVCIAPGLVRTEMAAGLVEIFDKNPESLAKYNPIARIGEPEDIAGLAVLLSGEAGRFCSATTIVFDGGEMNQGVLD